MFSVNHILWMLICIILTAGALFCLKKYRPSFTQVLNIACAVCILSELVKVFGTIELIPSADGSMLYPYLEMFLYHVMLLVLGIYIFNAIRDQITPKHYLSTLLMVACFGFLSVYFNSVFAAPVYVDGKLQSVEFTTNFFFTYKPPIPVTLRTEGQWFLYLGILAVLAVVLIGILYIPVFRRARKQA